jgi:hypothetical protein
VDARQSPASTANSFELGRTERPVTSKGAPEFTEITTAFGALVTPTAWLPKLTVPGVFGGDAGTFASCVTVTVFPPIVIEPVRAAEVELWAITKLISPGPDPLAGPESSVALNILVRARQDRKAN